MVEGLGTSFRLVYTQAFDSRIFLNLRQYIDFYKRICAVVMQRTHMLNLSTLFNAPKVYFKYHHECFCSGRLIYCVLLVLVC